MDQQDFPDLTTFLSERGIGPDATLRDHLRALQGYAGDLYAGTAGQTLESLDPALLDAVPEEIEQEEEPDCVVYYLQDREFVRVLPDYAYETGTWEDVEDEEDDSFGGDYEEV